MATFKDKAGGEWEVRLLAGHLRPMREKYDIDTKGEFQGVLKSVAEVVSDAERLYELLAFLCSEQMTERNIDPMKFAMLLDSKAIKGAAMAVTETVVDFCQSPEVATSTVDSLRATMATVSTMTADFIRHETPMLISKLSSGSLPESLESIQAGSRSAN